MTRTLKIVLGVAALALAATAASAAYAQATTGRPGDAQGLQLGNQGRQARPQGQRQTNADGSWREEIRQGKCVTIKEKSAAGEYKETRTLRLDR